MSSSAVDPEDVERELERLLASPEFKRNRNASAFLRFVVGEVLAGRGDRLKAFTIATLALHRDDNFDPQTNSIVRVQATRVRHMLETYYAGSGCEDPVRISLPRGSYAPVFERGAVASDPGLEASRKRPGFWSWRSIASLALLASTVTAGSYALVGERFSAPDGAASAPREQTLSPVRAQPLVHVVLGTALQSSEETRSFLKALAAAIRLGISSFDHLTVAHDDAPSTQPDYILSIAQRGRSDVGENIAFQLVHRETGAIVWASELKGISLNDPAGSLQTVTRSVVVAVGELYGPLFVDWERRVSAAGQVPAAMACAYSAYGFLKTRVPSDRVAAVSCLEQEVIANPADATLTGLLATMLLRGYADVAPGSRGAADLQRAVQLARRAHALAPYRAQAQFTLFQARFYAGRYEDAFAMGKQALASNPYSTHIRAALGAAYVARGQYGEGVDLLRDSYAQDASLPGSYRAFVALGAYMTGNTPVFADWALRTTAGGTPVTHSVRLLAFTERGDVESMRAVWNSFAQLHPAFAADPAASLARNGFEPVSRDLLLKAMVKAQEQAAPPARTD